MSKDPALLFYPKDVLADCSILDAKQCGFYIKIICLQHHFGHLSEIQVINICGTLEKDLLFVLKKDETGLYYIEWVDREILRRSEFSASRRNNRLGKGKKTKGKKTSVKHLGTETATITEDVFLKYCSEILKEKYSSLEFSLKAKYQQWLQAGWIDGNGQEIKNWKTKIQNTIPHLKPMQNGKHSISSKDLNLPEGSFPLFKKD